MVNRVQVWSGMQKELVIPSDPAKILLVEKFIEEIKAELEFKDDVYGNVMVAITEAVNNSILHGNQSNIQKSVFITAQTLNPYRLTVEVKDEGTGFNPDQLNDPTSPEFLENPGGRGVFLMRHLADEINFLDDGRIVQMIFNI